MERETLELCFFIPGPPQPKERARKGRGGHWYTPERTRAFEESVKTYGLLARRLLRPLRWPLDARYRVECWFAFPDRRPRDVDNCIKAVKDGLESALYNNDRQVDEGSQKRLPLGYRVGTYVRVTVI